VKVLLAKISVSGAHSEIKLRIANGGDRKYIIPRIKPGPLWASPRRRT
jgi:ribosomal protein S28E/S33